MVLYSTAVRGPDGDDDDYDFEKLFTSSFGSDDQFEPAFHRSEHLFLRACSILEEAEGWGVGDWQAAAAASWTVTAMVDTLNWEGSDVDGNADTNDDSQPKQRKIRQRNRYRYQFGDVMTSPFYINFLAPGVRGRTHRLGTEDRFGQFRAWFRLPLHMISDIADQFIDKGYLHATRRIRNTTILQAKAELIVLACLNVLAHGTPFRCLPLNTHISANEHRLYFLKFVEMFSRNQKQYISLPRNYEELEEVMGRYRDVGLPGAMGSVDVVHCKWSRCPAGDFNRAKGKEGYPTLAFQCISDFDRRINGIFGPQWGTRNDKHIVKLDPNVKQIRAGWYKDVEWCYYAADGTVQTDTGAYLISDNGYLRWPITICPFMHAQKTTCEGYFSTNLESVRKDVECVFGILKKRWKILDYGFKHRSIKTCSDIFATCCCLHNVMLEMMERMAKPPRVGRGMPIGTDGIWLGNPSDLTQNDDPIPRILASQWNERRWRLAEHLKVWKSTTRGINRRSSFEE